MNFLNNLYRPQLAQHWGLRLTAALVVAYASPGYPVGPDATDWQRLMH